MRRSFFGIALALALPVAAVAAQEVEPRIQSTSISFSGGQSFTNAVLTVTGPNDYMREESASRGMPIFRLQSAGRLIDGYYQFSLIAATDKEVPRKSTLNDGRGEDARRTEFVPFSMQGAFRVEQGLIVPLEESEGGADSDG